MTTTAKDVGGLGRTFTISTAIVAIFPRQAAAARMSTFLLVFHTDAAALRVPFSVGALRSRFLEAIIRRSGRMIASLESGPYVCLLAQKNVPIAIGNDRAFSAYFMAQAYGSSPSLIAGFSPVTMDGHMTEWRRMSRFAMAWRRRARPQVAILMGCAPGTVRSDAAILNWGGKRPLRKSEVLD